MITEIELKNIIIKEEYLIPFSFILGIIGYILIIVAPFFPWCSYTYYDLYANAQITEIYYLVDADNFAEWNIMLNLISAIVGNLMAIIFLALYWIKKFYPSLIVILDIISINIILLINNYFTLNLPSVYSSYGFQLYTVAISLLIIMMILSLIVSIMLKIKKD